MSIKISMNVARVEGSEMEGKRYYGLSEQHMQRSK